MNCPSCSNAKLKRSAEEQRITVGTQTFVATLPVMGCAVCGESYLDGPMLEAFEREVARHLAGHGPATGETFRFMRKAIGVAARDVAALLQTTPETVSRWETGARGVDACAWTTLGALVLDELSGQSQTRQRLEALHTKRLAKTVPIKVAARAKRSVQAQGR